jgi:hypothetical protein
MKGLRHGSVAEMTEYASSVCVQAEKKTPSKEGSMVKKAWKK